MKTWYI